MSETSSGNPNNDSLWAPFDPVEETERVQRHIGMLEDLLIVDPLELDSSGIESSVVTKIYFDRLVDHDGRQSLSPYIFEGFLERIETIYGVQLVVVSNLKTYLFSECKDPDSDEPEIELLVAEDALAYIPIREISDIMAAQGTPGGWEAHAKGKTDEETPHDTAE